MFRSVISTLVVVSMVSLFAANATAAMIGAGVGISLEEVDTPGGGPRLNIDENYTLTLDAGSYIATSFSFAAGQDGDATPFLATLTGNNDNEYEVIALGGQTVLAGAPATVTVPFGGSDLFTLSETTTLYAGFVNSADSPHNPIYLDNGTVTTTDHDNVFAPITSVGQLIGSPAEPFGHANLGRTYAFSIDVQVVPEPSALALAAIGVLGLAAVSYRRYCKS